MTVAADRRSSGWFWLVQVAASVEAALLFVAGAYLRDAEALGFAFVVLLTLGSIALPAALGTTAVVGLIAAAGFLLTRGNPMAGLSASRVVGAAALVIILGVTTYGAVNGSGRSPAAASDLAIS